MTDKILVKLENEKNQRLLEDFLGERYDVIVCGTNLVNHEFDLGMVGEGLYPKLKEQIGEKKKREEPLFLPIILLASPDEKQKVTRFLEDSVDEVIFKPVMKLELEARVESLLKTRRLSFEKKQSLRDPLTGCYNRRYLEEALQREIERSKRYNHPFTLMMIDINNFKEVNDRHSHMLGDEVLQKITGLIKENIRDADTLIRYGGDEFLILLPETGTGSSVIASRLKGVVRSWAREADFLKVDIGLAIGTASWDPQEEKEVEEVLTQADRGMYRNKQAS